MNVFESVDWSDRGAYMQARHGISAAAADDTPADPNRVVIDPDYASVSGRSVRVIGWLANEKDRRIYREGEDSGEDQ